MRIINLSKILFVFIIVTFTTFIVTGVGNAHYAAVPGKYFVQNMDKTGNMNYEIINKNDSNINLLDNKEHKFISKIYKYNDIEFSYLPQLIIKNPYVDIQKILDHAGVLDKVLKIETMSITDNYYIISLNVTAIESIYETIKNSGKCELVEIDLLNLNNNLDAYTDNPLYPNQWYLNNTSNQLLDINAPQAWFISKGEGVKVAVMDSGFDMMHPDLIDNIENGIDVTSDKCPNGSYKAGLADANHGTMVGGIIGASDNNIGIIGVAPKSTIIPIKTFCSEGVENSVYIKAFKEAYNRNVDVVNMSFHYAPSQALTDAMNDLANNGRNRKGCVLIAASGNNGYTQNINFPASSLDVLSVGGIDLYGRKAGYSNTSELLDVVAGSDQISTTDINGLYTMDAGTSFSCPQVSGIAALVLSVNPDLTSREVFDIIRSTCKKLPKYQFSARENGLTWNDQVGYGLVDAFAAVFEAKMRKASIIGPSVVGSYGEYQIQNLPGISSVWWSLTNNDKNTVDVAMDDVRPNLCMLTNQYNETKEAKLVAEVTAFGITKKIEKNVSFNGSVSTTVSGTFDQRSCGGNSTDQSGSISELIRLFAPCPAYFRFGSDALGLDVRYLSGPGASWFYDKMSRVLSLTFQNEKGIHVFELYGGDVVSKRLSIRVLPVEGGIMSIRKFGDNIEIVLSNKDIYSHKMYHYSVTNIMTGEQVCEKISDEETLNISTHGWDSGIYVIQMSDGENILYEKFSINRK